MKALFFSLTLFLVYASSADGYRTEWTVAKDSTGDFTSIQECINATKSFPYERITITVKPGVYEEKIEVHAWNTKVALIGESPENTIIIFGDNFKTLDKGRNGTFHTYTLLVDGNDFYAENLTIVNTSGPVGQAVAIHVEADRVAFKNCVFKGWQDTMYLAGEGFRTYFEGCVVEGSTDFIFGEGTAWFESCEIKSLRNSYVTAASTPHNQNYGFVFNDCKLTASDGVNEVYLGRPWRKYAKTVFINCELGAHIRKEGWKIWSNKDQPETVLYAEYRNTGEGANTSERVGWSIQLSRKQIKSYKIDRVLRGWMPAF